MKIFLFSKPDCPGCVRAKTNLRQLGVKFEEVDASNGGMPLARHYGIRGVPSLILQRRGEGRENEWLHIDAGLSSEKLEKRLREAGVAFEKICS